MNTVAPGDTVVLHYRLAAGTGEELEGTFGGEPATLTLGRGELAENLERCLIGLASGEQRVFLLPPEQAYYARENLKLRLLTARLALFHHDEASYRRDLKAAQAWLARYFDTQEKEVRAAGALLRQLAESPVRVDVPDIATSLAAVRNFRLTQERGAR